MQTKFFIKNRKRRKEEFQFFMHDFIDECISNRIQPLPDILPSYRWHIRAVARRLLLFFYRTIHKLLKKHLLRSNGDLIITANGSTIEDSLFPYFFGYNIIPMLWDCWPDKWDTMIKDFELFDIKTVMVTSSQIAERINKETNVHAVWIPEGIKSSLYHKGNVLKDRTIDVMDMGRRMPKLEKILSQLKTSGIVNQIITSHINKDGNLNDKNIAYSNDELHHLMADSKIMVCFPRCDTNPETAVEIETLTQRYWEAMLSRCVIIGRAPKELINIIGYNPVIDVDWNNAEEQITHILATISDYQELVDKNYKTAIEYADWNKRMKQILNVVNIK